MALAEDNLSNRYEVLPSFRFTLMLEGGEEIALKSVKPFQKENEFEIIEEGGMNDFVRIKRKHTTKPHTIQVERYVNESFYDPFPNGGAEFVLPLLLFVGPNNASKFGWSGSERVFVFFGGMVMNREMGGFDSEKSGLLTETITIAYNQLYSMDVPRTEGLKPWEFANGLKNAYANPGWMSKIAQNNTKFRDLERDALAATWHFGTDETEYTGAGPRTYENEEKKVPQNKKTRKQLESAAKTQTWHFGTDATEYEGKTGARSYEDEEKKVPKNLVKKSTLSQRAKGQTWHFGEGPDDYKGNDKRHAANGQVVIPQNKVEKKQLVTEAEEATWKFKDEKSYKGNGKTHGSEGDIAIPQNKVDKSQLAGKAEGETWKFTDKDSYQGNGKTHPTQSKQVIPQNNKQKAQLATAAEGETWKFKDANTYQGNGKTHGPEGEITIPQNKQEKEQLKGKAEGQTWKFQTDPKAYKGNGTTHAEHISGEKELAALEGMATSITWPAGHHALTMPDGNTATDKKTLESQAAGNTWPRSSHALKSPGSKEAMLKK